MLSDANLTSNVLENLQAISSETVKGVLVIPAESHEGSEWLIVFESGYSLSIHTTNCAFWINGKNHTKELISTEASRRLAFIKNLEEVKKLL